MLEPLFTSGVKEKILFYLYRNREAYPTDLARRFKVGLISVQKQFQNLEKGGVVVSRLYGNVRLYHFNPLYALKKELKSLLAAAYRRLPLPQKRVYDNGVKPLDKRRRRAVVARMVRRGGEEDFDADFWKKQGAEKKFAAAWEMISEVELFRGKHAGKSRLQRSVQHIQRRRS